MDFIQHFTKVFEILRSQRAHKYFLTLKFYRSMPVYAIGANKYFGQSSFRHWLDAIKHYKFIING